MVSILAQIAQLVKLVSVSNLSARRVGIDGLDCGIPFEENQEKIRKRFLYALDEVEKDALRGPEYNKWRRYLGTVESGITDDDKRCLSVMSGVEVLRRCFAESDIEEINSPYSVDDIRRKAQDPSSFVFVEEDPVCSAEDHFAYMRLSDGRVVVVVADESDKANSRMNFWAKDLL